MEMPIETSVLNPTIIKLLEQNSITNKDTIDSIKSVVAMFVNGTQKLTPEELEQLGFKTSKEANVEKSGSKILFYWHHAYGPMLGVGHTLKTDGNSLTIKGENIINLSKKDAPSQKDLLQGTNLLLNRNLPRFISLDSKS